VLTTGPGNRVLQIIAARSARNLAILCSDFRAAAWIFGSNLSEKENRQKLKQVTKSAYLQSKVQDHLSTLLE